MDTFIFMPMKDDKRKNLKIPVLIHRELKVYAAQSGNNMDEVAEIAITNELKLRGHKFIVKPEKK